MTVDGEKLLDGPYADDVLENTIQKILTEKFEFLIWSYKDEDYVNYAIEDLECCRPEIEDAVLSYRQRTRYFQQITEWIICCREILKFAGLDTFLDDFNRELGNIKFPEKEEQLARLIGLMGSAKKLYSLLKVGRHFLIHDLPGQKMETGRSGEGGEDLDATKKASFR